MTPMSPSSATDPLALCGGVWSSWMSTPRIAITRAFVALSVFATSNGRIIAATLPAGAHLAANL